MDITVNFKTPPEHTMELRLKRTTCGRNYTLGRLYADGQLMCDTLEPTRRDLSTGRFQPARTAIPEGRYPVLITYSDDLYAWRPLLLHVPRFKDVRIREGTTAASTQGDILVGIHRHGGVLIDSHLWVARLKRLIVMAKSHGEGVWITVH